MAQSYDRVMRKTERLCLNRWRRELLARTTGELLEIGAGTGINLPHYPANQKLILCEPNAQMRKQLHKKLALETNQQVQVTDWPAEQIDLPDNSLDTIVSTLVLCSVKNQQQVLKEIHRVLRPGGQLLFMEHVRSENRRTMRWQKLCEPFWRCACGNCHLTRATVNNIAANGMMIEELQEGEMLGAPVIARRTLRGRARKTDSPVDTFVQNQDFDLNETPSCPHCSSRDVAKMIYGKPALTRQIIEGLESGKIISGGCMIHGGAPEWHCNSCRQDFGHQTFDPQR